jgi:serine/threonine protein kinase
MVDSDELAEGEAPATPTEERLARFLDEAANVAQKEQSIDVAVLLKDQPDLIDHGHRLIQGLKSLQRAAATTPFQPARPADDAILPDPFPGEFCICGLLGKGTFGKVWLADDLRLGRRVALKTLHLPAGADPSALAALEKEAKILAGLDHPNVVKVHAWRQAGAEHYLVMEYVAGGSLADLLQEEGPMSWQRAARYIASVAEGLVEVHAHGIIHRDIKASNTLWEPARDDTKLTDFGVAGRLGATRTIVGTPVFMAPEALRGRATPASDVYGLAATLFHLTTGELPFAGTTADELAARAAPGLTEGDDRFRLVPQRLEAIIRAGLATDATDRPLLRQFIDLLWGALNQTLVDGLATPQVRLRLEVKRRVAEGWRAVVASRPAADPLHRDIRRVPPGPGRARVQTGEALRLEVEADRPGYLAIYNVGPTGNLDLLYPVSEYGDKPVVQAGQVVRIDDLELQPPAGRERMFAVWSSRPLPLSVSELQSIAEGNEGSKGCRSSRDIVRVHRALEEMGPEGRGVAVLEVEHEPSA